MTLGTTTTDALIPSKLSYLTEQEWEAAAANYAPPLRKEATLSSSVSSFLEQASSAILQLGHRVLLNDEIVGAVEDEDDDMVEDEDDDYEFEGDEDDAVDDEDDDEVSLADNDDISTETAEIFDAATGGDVDDDEVASGEAVTFDPPIEYSQYTSDTCDTDTLVYSGTISSITLIEAGEEDGGSVFCINGVDFLEGDSGSSTPKYTKFTNVQCDVFGVEDLYEDCNDAECSDCDGADGTYLALSNWDQIFPNPVEDHCFQQIFSDDGETFDDETNVNVDFQFTTDSTEAGVKYMTFIALNSCIQNFVSSDGVVFTADSITVTDDEGDSITLTEDSMTMADADGGSIVITDDAVTISGADDDAGLVIENADVTSTDDGGMVIENDDIELVVTESGDFVATTDDSVTYGDGVVYVSFGEDSATFGMTNTEESFTIPGTVGGTTSLVFRPDTGGSIKWTDDDMVYVEGVDLETGEATFTGISDPVYNYTIDEESGEGYFTISGSTEECEDFVVGFNAETVYVGTY